MTTSLIGSFLGASKKALPSAIAGILTMSIAGEMADKSKGMGTFHTALIDRISEMNYRTLIEKAKISLYK